MDREMLAALLRLVVLLPLVCGLAYLAVRFGFGARYLPVHGRGRRMRLVEQVPLGPKYGLSLVQVGDRYLLLAHQEGGVTVVREMDELPAEIPAESIGRPWPPPGPFGARIKK